MIQYYMGENQKMGSSTDEKFSSFGRTFISYGVYHYNFVNKIIHIICVPIITATLFALLSYVPYHVNVAGYQIGAVHLFCLAALFYHLSINLLITGIMVSIFFTFVWLWRKTFAGFDDSSIFTAIAVIQAVSWILQFIGHGVFEKRKPALMDNLLQIFSAPSFVLIQFLCLLGLKTKQFELWQAEIKRQVQEYRNSKAK